MIRTWEHYDSVDYEVNGRTIKVAEWRKDFDDGQAVIRMGYLRIDNCPRYQIVVTFKDTRLFKDRPPFRKFDDALEAANAWLANRANRMQAQPHRRMSATPQSAEALALPPSDQGDMFVTPFKSGDARLKANRDARTTQRLPTAEFEAIIREEYSKLDHGRTSLEELRKAVVGRIGYEISKSTISNRSGDKEGMLPMERDKRAAMAIARPKIRAKLVKIIAKHPAFGFYKCLPILEKSTLGGYTRKWVEGIYYEARKEYGFTCKGNVWTDDNMRR